MGSSPTRRASGSRWSSGPTKTTGARLVPRAAVISGHRSARESRRPPSTTTQMMVRRGCSRSGRRVSIWISSAASSSSGQAIAGQRSAAPARAILGRA